MKHRARFTKNGALAFHAAALSFWFECDDTPKAAFELVGDAAVVTIEGALTHHTEWFWDSYDAILGRVKLAAESAAKRVVLKIDSPGGDVSGCFETARAIRDVVKASGKTLVSYADGLAASAGYAIASVADEICLPPTAFVGSIGVINSLYDLTAANERYGVRVAVVASGAKKAIGNPNKPIDEAAIAEVQSQVDQLAEIFFDHVAMGRPMTPAQIKGLEAGIFLGKQAVTAGLADRICTFEELLAMGASDDTAGPVGAEAKKENTAMGWKDDMRKAADDGDEEAKKCLEAIEEDEKSDDKKDDEKSEDEKTDDKAEGDEPVDDEKKKDDKAAAAHVAATIALAGSNLSMGDRLGRLETLEERRSLLATRPDLTRQPKVKAWLETAPIATVREAVKNIEKPAAPKPAAALSAAPTVRGANEGAPSAATVVADDPERASIRKRMRSGVIEENRSGAAVQMKGNKMEFLPMTPAQAKARLAEIQKERGGSARKAGAR